MLISQGEEDDKGQEEVIDEQGSEDWMNSSLQRQKYMCFSSEKEGKKADDKKLVRESAVV
jgi:hypothetical protein